MHDVTCTDHSLQGKILMPQHATLQRDAAMRRLLCVAVLGPRARARDPRGSHVSRMRKVLLMELETELSLLPLVVI